MVMVVLVVGLGACHETGRSSALHPAAPACARPVVPASRTVAFTRSGGTAIAQPGGGAITVTAIGFSQTEDGMLSIGAEVGNSGTRVAYDTSVVFRPI
jgi:hypothetical protein